MVEKSGQIIRADIEYFSAAGTLCVKMALRLAVEMIGGTVGHDPADDVALREQIQIAVNSAAAYVRILQCDVGVYVFRRRMVELVDRGQHERPLQRFAVQSFISLLIICLNKYYILIIVFVKNILSVNEKFMQVLALR